MRWRRGKYGNKKTEVDGRMFDSKREANRYGELKLLEKDGQIINLQCQRTYRLEVNGILVCKYIADFVYGEGGKLVVEDTKGHRTREYILKKKLMRAVHGIEIRES